MHRWIKASMLDGSIKSKNTNRELTIFIIMIAKGQESKNILISNYQCHKY
jgi:hypothetical protein